MCSIEKNKETRQIKTMCTISININHYFREVIKNYDQVCTLIKNL